MSRFILYSRFCFCPRPSRVIAGRWCLFRLFRSLNQVGIFAALWGIAQQADKSLVAQLSCASFQNDGEDKKKKESACFRMRMRSCFFCVSLNGSGWNVKDNAIWWERRSRERRNFHAFLFFYAGISVSGFLGRERRVLRSLHCGKAEKENSFSILGKFNSYGSVQALPRCPSFWGVGAQAWKDGAQNMLKITI